MTEYKYKLSIVIPVYNVEKYLEEAIESIIGQTLGFEQNIQLILVNDGSIDKSEEICAKYKKKYPQNIIYLKQENKGVSSARNLGIQYIDGKYVNFLDGDDKWSLDALEKIYNFLEKNYDNIDFAVGRKKIFEAKDEFHVLDYKFERTKVVDIFEDYNFAQMDVTSVVFKTDIVKTYTFKENLRYAEDADFVNRILLEKNKYGVIREAIHLYRKRHDETSVMQNLRKSRSWFIDTIEYFHKNIFEISKTKFGEIIPYVQYIVMYDIQWRLKKTNFDAINYQEKEEYIKTIIYLLKNIDDYIIIKQKNIFAKTKLYALSLKYGRNIWEELEFKNGKFYFNNLEVYRIKNKTNLIRVDSLEIKKGVLILKGKTLFAIPRDDYELYANTNLKQKIKIELIEEKKDVKTFTGESFKNYIYTLEIPLEKVKKINFSFEYKNGLKQGLKIGFGKKLTFDKLLNSYYSKGKYIITYSEEEKRFIVKKVNIKQKIKYKLNYLKELKELKKTDIIKYKEIIKITHNKK